MNRILFLGGLHRSEGELIQHPFPSPFLLQYVVYIPNAVWVRTWKKSNCLLGRDEKIKFGLTICGGNNLI